MNYDELLAIVKDIPDDTEFELGGRKVKAADLKTATSAQAASAAKALKDAENARTAAAADAEKASLILAELQKLQQPPAPPKDDSDDWDTNNWWTPARKRMDAVTKAVEEQKKQTQQILEAVTRASTIWANDRWQSQYDRGSERLKKSAKGKDMSFEQVRDYAVANKLMDVNGFPSIDKAISEITKEDELAVRLAEARAEGAREERNRARLNATSRPTSAAGHKPQPGKGLDPSKNFEDLGDVVAEDPELMELVSQVQGLNPEDIIQ